MTTNDHETITCPRCRGGTSKLEDPCILCNGTGKAPRNKIYKDLGNGVLYFFLQSEFGFSDCIRSYRKDNPNTKITSMTGSFSHGGYGSYIQGYVVIIDN
jgi:hypothetical protein